MELVLYVYIYRDEQGPSEGGNGPVFILAAKPSEVQKTWMNTK